MPTSGVHSQSTLLNGPNRMSNRKFQIGMRMNNIFRTQIKCLTLRISNVAHRESATRGNCVNAVAPQYAISLACSASSSEAPYGTT